MADDLAIAVRQLQAVVRVGTGVPTVDPGVPRAIFVRLDGGANTTLYVWEGAAWAAK